MTSFFFDPEDPLFQDHFPGCPVVPGSLILDCFHKAAQKAGGQTLKLAGIQNGRFDRFARPGHLDVEVERSEGPGGTVQLKCRAVQDGKTISSALLRYERI